MSSRLPRLAQLDAASAGSGWFLCTRKERRAGRHGDFLVLTLQDASGQITGKLLQDVEDYDPQFEAGEFVAVQGRGSLFHDRLELVVERIRRVIPEDAARGFREEDCVPCSPRPVDEMWTELGEWIARVGDPHLRELLGRVVSQHEARLRVWPAARQVHHAYRSGLLEHVLQIMRTVSALADIYGARRDLLIAGALLHDIGKLRELSYDLSADYTVEGNLLGHITIGAGMVRDAVREIPGFPPALATEIEHLILSHHGEIPLGSPVKPMTAEAFILAAADGLDASLHQVRRHLAEDTSDAPFTSYQRYLARALYKPPTP